MLLLSALSVAAALSNTAPFLLVSGQTDLPDVNGADITSLESSLADSLSGCVYDSYVFASMDGISSRDVNGKNMPELVQLIQKASAHRTLPAVADFDKYQRQAEQTVRSVCGAEDIAVNENGEYELFQDISTRILEVNLGNDAKGADATLAKVIGHLNSGNFLLVLRSLPGSDADISDIPVEESNVDGQEQHIEADDKLSGDNLFTDYTFVSPGLFMAGLLSIAVASILFISLGWLSSLQVSYKAFEKAPSSEKRD